MSYIKLQQKLRNLPLPVYDYFDVVGIWLKDPLSRSEQKWLRARCGPGGLHVLDEPAMFDWRYRQRLTLYQPSREALEALARLDSPLINYVEVARDLILPDEQSKRVLLDLFQRCYIQPWHGKKRMKFYPNGFSTREMPARGDKRTGSWFQGYIPETSKLTGEIHCFHFEGKHQGVQFVRRIGIHSPDDLLNFDFVRYFAKHITLYEVDVERLGRYHDNKQTGRKRKCSHIRQYGSFVYNFDRRRGGTLYHVRSVNPDGLSRSLQTFVDRYGRGPFLKRLSLEIFMSTKASCESIMSIM